jgi:putative ABC transport system substrate-binding protein
MARNTFLVLLAALALISPDLAQAQQQTKVKKIGLLSSFPASRRNSGTEVIRRELRELGYFEGKNISFEYRYSEGKLDRLPALSDELVRLKVDVILTFSTPAARALKDATSRIPIVFSSEADPVTAGLVESLARPGGNVTGFSRISSVIAGKRLELLKEIIPKLSRIAVLWTSPGSQLSWKESQLAAQQLGMQLHSMELNSADQFNSAFKDAINAGSAALAVTPNPLTNSNRKLIADLAVKHRLPTIYPREVFVENGGLMSYGADQDEPYKRVASMIDKILKGAKPADLPVEQPTKFELVINLKAAKQIDLAIPPNVLARANRVIR